MPWWVRAGLASAGLGRPALQPVARHTHRHTIAAALAALLTAGCGGGGGGTEPLPAFDTTLDVAVHDLNGDGRLDVAAVVWHVDGPPPHAGSVRVWLQRPDAPGVFAAPQRLAVGPDPARLRVADVDGDGRPDLVAMSSHASAVEGSPLVDTVAVLRQEPAAAGRFQPAQLLHAGARLADVAVADWDGDGLPDIVFSSYGAAARLGLWWNDRAQPGVFGAPAVTLRAGTGSAVAAADLNADGHVDLAFVADAGLYALTRDPAVARGFGAASLVLQTPLPTCLTPTDLDGDGLTDLVLGTRPNTLVGASGELQTLGNDPAQPGRFTVLQRLPQALHSWRCVAADLNGDGLMDVVSTGGGYAQQLFDDVIESFLGLNAPRGRLAAPPVLTVTRGTASGYTLALGDLDGDGRPDAVMPYEGGALWLRQDPLQPGAFLRVGPLP